MTFVKPDSEAALEEATLDLFRDLGWEVVNAYDEVYGSPDSVPPGRVYLGRETRSDVVLVPRLRAALVRLNPTVAPEALELAAQELTRNRSAMLPAQANREVYELLKDGVRVTYRTPAGDERVETVRVIDWTDPAHNDYFLAQQLWVTGDPYTRRPDLVGFVNGLPLVFVELKRSHRRLRDAYDGNLSDYKETIPALFWYNALVILSNGREAQVGSLTAAWRHFAEWKRFNRDGDAGEVPLETLVRAVCAPRRLLDLVENFTLFHAGRGETKKIIAKPHQYWGVNAAIAEVHDIEANEGRLGVFWHTQGSGKSFSMIFFSQKVLRRIRGNWTFVVITDRRDLDDQIYKNFAGSGAVHEPETQVRAQSGEHLKRLLQEDHRYTFTLIHKFHVERGQTYPTLSERDDIIVMTDEAHRTQYDILAQNMRNALPNASFIGFTGTPLMAEEEKTRAVFGDYVSIYNFKQSIDDGATVPLYYENRIPELQLTNETLNEEMEQLLEEAELDEAQERKLEQKFRNEYHIITRDDRLETIAEDVVQHFLGRGYQGKAMVVSIDKVTAGRMHQKVRRHWNEQLAILKADLETNGDAHQRAWLRERIVFMEATDMALVVSEGQNEVARFREKGLNIVPQRRRMKNEDLDEKFKDPEDPLRIVFVCAMWMTGFDVPSCSTIYLDKPMRNHTLMQTIARANRVFAGKNNGLIIDYIGVFRNLQKALAIYGSSAGGGIKEGERPIKDKGALVEELREALAEATAFCERLGIDVDALVATTEAFRRIHLKDDAVDAIVANDERKRRFLAHVRDVDRLFRAILPDERANEFTARHALFTDLAKQIKSLEPAADISEVMGQVEALLDRSVAAEPFTIREPGPRINLGEIDFDALRERFRREHKHIEVTKLRGAINQKLQQMVRLNRSRMDYLETFQEMIDAYNAGRVDVDVIFEKLISLVQQLQVEEQRTIAENLTEAELALFDILMKPRPELTDDEIEKVKEAARELLDTLQAEKLVLDWRKQQQARAGVQVTIADVLDDKLPTAYDADLFQQKCNAVYQHVYDSYYGDGRSVYSVVA